MEPDITEPKLPKRALAELTAPRPDVADRASPELEDEAHKPQNRDRSPVPEPADLGWGLHSRADDDHTPQLELDDRDKPHADRRSDRDAPQPDDRLDGGMDFEPEIDSRRKPREDRLSPDRELGWERALDECHTLEPDHAPDSLTDRDTVELEHDRDKLRKDFAELELPDTRDLTQLGCERERAQQEADETARRIARLQARRADLGLFHFSDRRELDNLLADAREQHEQQIERSRRAKGAHDLAESRIDDWLERYGDPAARLVATQRELKERRQLSEIAVARQQAAKRMPDWAKRELPAPELTPDLGRDLDTGMDMGW